MTVSTSKRPFVVWLVNNQVADAHDLFWHFIGSSIGVLGHLKHHRWTAGTARTTGAIWTAGGHYPHIGSGVQSVDFSLCVGFVKVKTRNFSEIGTGKKRPTWYSNNINSKGVAALPHTVNPMPNDDRRYSIDG